MIKQLLHSGFKVTVLTRNPSKAEATFPGVKAVEANYEAVDELASSLRDAGPFDAVVCLINRDQLQPMLNLTKATITAGVPHLVPSSFGVDMAIPYNRDMPPCREKLQMETDVMRKAKEGKLTFTAINTGLFLDWAIRLGSVVNLTNDGKPTRIYDDGDVKVSGTNLDDIGRAVAAALVHRDECVNKHLFVHSAVISQNQLLHLAKQLRPDWEFPTVRVDTAKWEKEAEESLKNGDTSMAAMRPYVIRSSFGLGLNEFKAVDNGTLGLPTLDESQLKKLIENIMKEVAVPQAA